MPRRVLLLGGTTESRELAERLDHAGVDVIVSLAGRTSAPVPSAGTTRVGGFGGPAGLADFLATSGITEVVCATHPFAAVMPFHAAMACTTLGLPLLRLLRPPWRPVDGDRWTDAPDLAGAADALRRSGARRVLLTTGRQELVPFSTLDEVEFTIRAIEPFDVSAFRRANVVLDRGPFTVAGERVLLLSRGIDAIVSKNSGGSATAAKLDAARQLGIDVVMVERPSAPDVPTFATIDEVVHALDLP